MSEKPTKKRKTYRGYGVEYTLNGRRVLASKNGPTENVADAEVFTFHGQAFCAIRPRLAESESGARMTTDSKPVQPPLVDEKAADLAELIDNECIDGHDAILNHEKCARIISTAYAPVLAERDRLNKLVLDFENREASVCPEDVGCDEYIPKLTAERDALREALRDCNTQLSRWASKHPDEWNEADEDAHDNAEELLGEGEA